MAERIISRAPGSDGMAGTETASAPSILTHVSLVRAAVLITQSVLPPANDLGENKQTGHCLRLQFEKLKF